jgi:hypothetical protein
MEGVRGSIPLPPTIDINNLDFFSRNSAHVSPTINASGGLIPLSSSRKLPMRVRGSLVVTHLLADTLSTFGRPHRRHDDGLR